MAVDLNHVTLIGRLTTDAPELTYFQSGAAKVVFSIAVNRRKKNGEQWVDEVSFFEIQLFGKSAENLKPYLTKGKQVAVDGELRQDRWEKDGQKHSKVYVVANNVQLLGGNSQGNGGSSAFNADGRGAASYSDSGYASQNNGYQYGGFRPQQNNSQDSYDSGSSYSSGSEAFPEDIPF